MMANKLKFAASVGLTFAVAMWLGWWLNSGAARPPQIRILAVGVAPSEIATGTRLHITTKYANDGCSQILLARFLLNQVPTPSIALPQQQGPTILPASLKEVSEDVDLAFKLHEGQWHLFTNVVCFFNDDPVPSAVVSPTALFDQG